MKKGNKKQNKADKKYIKGYQRSKLIEEQISLKERQNKFSPQVHMLKEMHAKLKESVSNNNQPFKNF